MGRIIATECLSLDDAIDRWPEGDGLDQDENHGFDVLPSWEVPEAQVRRLFDPRELQHRGH
jgi:hypothetical protein